MNLFSLLILISICFAAPNFFSEDEESFKSCDDNDKWEHMRGFYDVIPRKPWYYVMANKWSIITTTKALTGKAPTTMPSINKACFIDWWSDEGWLLKGYSKQVVIRCTNKFMGEAICTPTNDSTNMEWAEHRGIHDDTIVWFEYGKYILGVRCVGKFAAWSLRSTKNAAVDKKTKAIVLDKIKELGFDETDAVEITRRPCKPSMEFMEVLMQMQPLTTVKPEKPT